MSSSVRHITAAVKFSPAAIKREMAEVEGVNAKIAVLITRSVGTMACAYLFCLIALTSLPAILIQAGALKANQVPTFLTKPGLILVVSWIAQTLLQLVLLSIILVGQAVQAKASDARAEKQFTDTETIVTHLTEPDGIDTIIAKLDALNAKLDGTAPSSPAV